MKWCSLDCSDADFPDSNSFDGACNRINSILCKKYNRLIPKHSQCLDNKSTSVNLNGKL